MWLYSIGVGLAMGCMSWQAWCLLCLKLSGTFSYRVLKYLLGVRVESFFPSYHLPKTHWFFRSSRHCQVLIFHPTVQHREVNTRAETLVSSQGLIQVSRKGPQIRLSWCSQCSAWGDEQSCCRWRPCGHAFPRASRHQQELLFQAYTMCLAAGLPFPAVNNLQVSCCFPFSWTHPNNSKNPPSLGWCMFCVCLQHQRCAQQPKMSGSTCQAAGIVKESLGALLWERVQEKQDTVLCLIVFTAGLEPGIANWASVQMLL